MKKNSRTSHVAVKAGMWYLVCNFILKGISFLTAPFFNRILTETEIGLYSNIISWVSIITVIVTLDLHSSVNNAKFDYKDKEFDAYISSILILGTGITLIVFIFALFSSDAIESLLNVNTKYIYIIFVYLLVSPAVSILLAKYRAFIQYKETIILTTVSTMANVIVSVVLVMVMDNKLDARIYGTYIPGYIISVIIYVVLLRKSRDLKVEYCKYAVKISAPLAVHLLSGTILSSSDRIMITNICGAEKNALYSVAYLFATVLLLIWSSVNGAWAPWCFEQFDSNRFNKVKAPSLFILFGFGFLCLIVVLLAPEGLYILGGKNYMSAAYVVPPIMCGCIAIAAYSMYVNVEQFFKKQIFVAIGTGVAALINIGLNWILIPVFGYVASAYTTFIGYIVLFAFHYVITRFVMHKKVYNNILIIIYIISFSILFICIGFIYDFILIRFIISLLIMALLFIFVLKGRKGNFNN